MIWRYFVWMSKYCDPPTKAPWLQKCWVWCRIIWKLPIATTLDESCFSFACFVEIIWGNLGVFYFMMTMTMISIILILVITNKDFIFTQWPREAYPGVKMWLNSSPNLVSHHLEMWGSPLGLKNFHQPHRPHHHHDHPHDLPNHDHHCHHHAWKGGPVGLRFMAWDILAETGPASAAPM